VKRAAAAAKINLALVVGPRRADGLHEVATIYQRIALSDRITITRSPQLKVVGFPGDTIVRRALERVSDRSGASFAARIEKRIPVAAGLGGGSSDAATALRLANELRDDPHPSNVLLAHARELGADVPFFLADGPQLGSGDGSDLTPIELPQDYWILLVMPRDTQKRSTKEVYDAFDSRNGQEGFDERRDMLLGLVDSMRRPRDLAALPPNDLASSPIANELRGLGAFRADVTGAGPVVYGLFLHGAQAREARKRLSPFGRTWLTAPAWYR
jgi:4-diphosphocytidyl-2-C-methyl-D-erythritol kinase